MFRKYLYLLILSFVLSGCVTLGRAPAVVPAQGFALGTIQNPVVDSDIPLSAALKKYAPVGFKKKQRILDVLYYSFDGKVHKGQVVINRRLTKDIRQVFEIILDNKFPVESVIPVSHDRFYKNGEWNRDGQSMLSNNTSAFNFRKVTGGKVLSMHSYGYAIDINPVQNPYIKGKIVLPEGAVYDPAKPGTLTASNPVVRSFQGLGWEWGGNWKSLKDYQHFQKVLD